MTTQYEEMNAKTMRELIEMFTHNTTARSNIYSVYRQAAELDTAMVELKKEENLIRNAIARKVPGR